MPDTTIYTHTAPLRRHHLLALPDHVWEECAYTEISEIAPLDCAVGKQLGTDKTINRHCIKGIVRSPPPEPLAGFKVNPPLGPSIAAQEVTPIEAHFVHPRHLSRQDDIAAHLIPKCIYLVLALLCLCDRLLFAIQPQVLESTREGGHGYAFWLKSKSELILQLIELPSVVCSETHSRIASACSDVIVGCRARWRLGSDAPCFV